MFPNPLTINSQDLAHGSSLLAWRQQQARDFKNERIALANEAFAEQYQKEIPCTMRAISG
jgi:hypothetical protein